LDCLHADLVGLVKDTSVHGHRFWLTLVDDHSRQGWSIPLKTKDQAKQFIINWITRQEKHTGQHLKTFHSDRGSEFLNAILETHLAAHGTDLYLGNRETPQQNGIAEARNKTVGTIARALVLHSQAPKSFWSYAVQHANNLANLFPHHLLAGQTPAEVWHGAKPDCTHLRVWGCTAHVLLTSYDKSKTGGKFHSKTKACAYLGKNPQGPGHLLWDGTSRRSFCSSDVIF
jgi:transposase InsO family protein